MEDVQKLKHYNEILLRNLRETDTFGVGNDGYLYILLANSNKQEANIVIRRFAAQGLVCSLKESM